MELSIDEFMLPLVTMAKSRFITARAAARHMIEQRSGVIIFVTGSPARAHSPGVTAIGAAFGAMETLPKIWPSRSARSGFASPAFER